jgi:hypothetical protein
MITTSWPCEPRVDVLLAACNGERFIQAQVDSILNQSHRPVRLLVLDDASDDGTWEILQALAARYPQITLARNEVRGGAINAFERLLHGVESEYFCFADQDDVWSAGKLAASLRHLRATGADLVYSDLAIVDENLEPLGRSMWESSRVRPLEGSAAWPLLIKNPVTGCTILARSELVAKVLPFPERIPMHDWWIALVAASEGGIAALPDQTVCYRQHASNVSGASAYGVSGIRHRSRKQHLSGEEYVRERLRRRWQLAAALTSRRFSRGPSFLAWYWTRSDAIRFVLAPAYLAAGLIFARRAGIQNIIADTVLSCVPPVILSAILGRRSTDE